MLGHVAVESEVVVFVCAREFELAGVACCGDDVVTFLEALFYIVVAKAGALGSLRSAIVAI